MAFTRRSVLESFAFLPWLLGGREVQPASDLDPRRQHLMTGLQVMRFLNTAQAWHRAEHGQFVDYRTLLESPVIGKIRTHPGAVRAGLGETLIGKLGGSAAAVLPGWNLRVTLLSSGQGYRASIEDSSPFRVGSLSTDETGLIQTFTGPVQAANGAGKAVARVVRAVAALSGTMSLNSTQLPCLDQFTCIDTCCVCVATCCVDCLSSCCQAYSMGCINCGCQTCRWSCDGWCWGE